MKRCSNTWDQCRNLTDHPSGICDVCRTADTDRAWAHDVRQATGKTKKLLPDHQVGPAPKDYKP